MSVCVLLLPQVDQKIVQGLGRRLGLTELYARTPQLPFELRRVHTRFGGKENSSLEIEWGRQLTGGMEKETTS